MPASYPSSAKAFTTKNDGAGNTILAAHINDLQLEVTAIETDLLAGLPVARGGTGLTAIGAVGTVPVSNGATLAYGLAGNYPADGRLTLTTATPVTSADVSAATVIYWAPYGGHRVALYDGAAWALYAFTERSISLPAVANQVYDVFVYNNAGTITLELTAWTNDTTRATALTTQDGVLVKTGATTRRYLGTVRTTAVAGQTEDSAAKRFVWNYYHRVDRLLRVTEGTDSWSYSTAVRRQANASTANQLAVVVGVAEVIVESHVAVTATSDANREVYPGIGRDSTTTVATGVTGMQQTVLGTSYTRLTADLLDYPPVGYHFYAWLELGPGAGTVTWYGDNAGASNLQSGIYGKVSA